MTVGTQTNGLQGHRQVLEDQIFQIHTKWPEFKPLLAAIEQIGASLTGNEVVVDLGRYYVYDGCCLFAPFFSRAKKYLGVDCVLPNWKEVYGYQRWMVGDPSLIRIRSGIVTDITRLPIRTEGVDWVLIPNIVEHINEPATMFSEAFRVLKTGGRAFVFAPHVREEHQPPYDYFRYTRYGLRHLFEKAGFEVQSMSVASGIFDVLSKTTMLALDCLPPMKRRIFGFFFQKWIKPALWRYDTFYQEHPVQTAKECPMAYLSFLKKP